MCLSYKRHLCVNVSIRNEGEKMTLKWIALSYKKKQPSRLATPQARYVFLWHIPGPLFGQKYSRYKANWFPKRGYVNKPRHIYLHNMQYLWHESHFHNVRSPEKLHAKVHANPLTISLLKIQIIMYSFVKSDNEKLQHEVVSSIWCRL